MTDGEFMRVTLRGGRFKDGEVPLPVLADLYSLQLMVIDVAGWRFKAKNQGRKRLPRNFDQIHLKITGLGRGSSVVTIGLDTTRPTLLGVPNQEYFEQAADDIADAIRLAEQDDEQLNVEMPNKYLDHFGWIGYHLSDSEELEIQTTTQAVPARLTTQSRERLVRHSAAATIMRDLTVRGLVYEADQKKMTFQLQPIHGSSVRCRIPEPYADTILEAFAGYHDNVRVLVRGTGIYDKQNHLSHVEPVIHVEQLDPLDVDARLDEFRNVQDGWLEDGGVAPDHAGLDWLSSTFAAYYPDDLPLPHTYLMADGGVSLEWSLGAKDVTVEVDIKTRKGEWYVYDKTHKRIEDETALDLGESTGWSSVAERLRTLDGKND